VRGDQSIDNETAGEIVSLSLFDAGAEAIGTEAGDDGETILVAGFATMAEATAAVVAVTMAHASLIVVTAATETLASDWTIGQRAGISPTQIGPWHIRGPWHPEQPGVEPRHEIVIEPGVAFGHGSHPTTMLVIELMLRHLDETTAPTQTVVDLGTGTGVVAIVAARLGANVRAVENDSDVFDVAWQNVHRNSVYPTEDTRDRLELILGDAADARIGRDDLVVANVTLDVQRLIAGRCQRAERVLVSGVLCHQVRGMQDLYPGHRASTIRTSGDWAGIEFLSNAAPSRKNT
jgi:ribosomal protein L11 methylase PrmA